MSIRRIQYQIDYVHILSFKDEYISAVTPFFLFEQLEYAVDNENTINETIRLIFKTDNLAIIIRKEAITFFYEGDSAEIKNLNGPLKIFWELFDKIKKFKDFTTATRHTLIVHAVTIQPKVEISKVLQDNPFFTKNPFGLLSEFACLYEFLKDENKYKFHFGNFTEKDIRVHDLRPFKTEFNNDLLKGVGIMGRLETVEIEKNPNHTKLKAFLQKSEKVFSEFNLIKDERN